MGVVKIINMEHQRIANNAMRFVRQGTHTMTGEEAETVYAEVVAWLMQIGNGGFSVLSQGEIEELSKPASKRKKRA